LNILTGRTCLMPTSLMLRANFRNLLCVLQ